MADNAIERLFEEMRAAKADRVSAHERHRQSTEMAERALVELLFAESRIALLQRALEKHIHEGMPIVQAKMIAHEEELNQPKLATGTITGSQVVAGTINAGNKGSIRRV